MDKEVVIAIITAFTTITTALIGLTIYMVKKNGNGVKNYLDEALKKQEDRLRKTPIVLRDNKPPETSGNNGNPLDQANDFIEQITKAGG